MHDGVVNRGIKCRARNRTQRLRLRFAICDLRSSCTASASRVLIKTLSQQNQMFVARSTKVAFLLVSSTFRLATPAAAFGTTIPLFASTVSAKRPSSSKLFSTMNKDNLINCPSVELQNGQCHPAIGFGTYKVGFIPASASSAVAGTESNSEKQRTAEECVSDALECGYRFLECAEFYGELQLHVSEFSSL